MDNRLMNAHMQLKMTAKMLDRQAKKAEKEGNLEKTKLEKAMKKGDTERARIYAQNAVRKQSESTNLLKLSSRVDSVAGRVKTASVMQGLMGNMQKTTRSIEMATNAMNLEKISSIMESFERNLETLDVVDESMREATASATATGTPQSAVDELLSQTADKVGVELSQDLETAPSSKSKLHEPEPERDLLGERLAALRN
ncbi:hypothetical protein K458DRAFT_394923 [Lentithecium fluviatile CBS 122367]|uniref:Uncharacterized protein n=1 Tax=Lentithecium fluviatile CBS 122367 TaxID=1168545 RepID=A0A6G1IJW1_9PLEO|nr:hypothetical protein K458DRAFT_394923 [Lentithecium fluviatile CBS 122367]